MKKNKIKKSLDRLPSKKDFDPWGYLDAQWAWDNFGNLSIEEAYDKFCKDPGNYQEDFMHMGPKAFSYYFRVIDKYMSEVEPEDEWDDCSGWIIGCGIESQIEQDKENCLSPRLLRLAEIVINRFGTFEINESEKEQVIDKWNEIKTKLTS